MELEALQEFRRDLHRHPELSGEEYKTQAKVKALLEPLNHQGLEEVGGTGLAIYFKGEKAGKRILLRADMDALPIEEINNFEHRSSVSGVSHKCGHDGHTTIMLGVAQALSKNPPAQGEVCLIFQPAEENGRGAKAIMQDPKFSFKADLAFALHNLPSYALHQVVCKTNNFTPAVCSVIFRFRGKTSHAAEPERGINPALAIAQSIEAAEGLCIKDIDREDFKLISFVYMHMGEQAYGISAGHGELHLTLRTWDNAHMDDLKKALLSKVEEVAHTHQLTLEHEWLEEFYANMNDDEAYTYIRESAESLQLNYTDRKQPFKWGEDFGLFTETFRGAMFGIGAGEDCPALHNPDYDYPDTITPTGVQMFLTLLEKAL